MAATYLKGAETIRVQNGPVAITGVRSGVILLVGTAQGGPVNVPTLCVGDTDDAQFMPANAAPELPGYTIMQALRAIRLQGAGSMVIVINVRDATWTDPTAAAKIIGGASAAGIRTGLALADDCYNMFGFAPKILIAPGYSPLAAVTAELIARANNLGAYALVDAPIGTSPAQAIAGRGPAGAINFNTASSRVLLCYPYVNAYDVGSGAVALQPLSQFAAGAMARKDLEKGVVYSASNTELVGVQSLERRLTARLDDPTCEVNQLVGAGICTVFNAIGTGFRFWGNRAANYPSTTGLPTFYACGRAQDALDEAIRFFCMPYLDIPLNNGIIDTIVMSINMYINTKVGNGEYLGGKAWYDPARNPITDLGNGQLRISYKFTPAPPVERLTMQSEMTGQYLATLKS